jgi:hypothetical protein
MNWCFEIAVETRSRLIIIIIIIIDQLLLWFVTKEEKISGACSIYCGNEKRIQRFVKKKEGKRIVVGPCI